MPGLITGDLIDTKATPGLPNSKASMSDLINGKILCDLNLQCLQQPEIKGSQSSESQQPPVILDSSYHQLSSQSLHSQQPSVIFDSSYHQLPNPTVQPFDTIDNCETPEPHVQLMGRHITVNWQ